MDTNAYLAIIKNPKKMDETSSSHLQEVIAEYPYFQSARALRLKFLQKSHSFKFNDELKKTAAYTVDRAILFEWIVNPISFNQLSSEIPVLEKKEDKNIQKQEKLSSVEMAEGQLKIGSPIQFSIEEPHSFSEWLQLAQKKPFLAIKEKPRKVNLIDQFIKNNPKIKPASKVLKSQELFQKSTVENEELMTETLARVYLEQKKYDKAIQAYHILSLKYPKKSGFFADQIQAIKILQNK